MTEIFGLVKSGLVKDWSDIGPLHNPSPQCYDLCNSLDCCSLSTQSCNEMACIIFLNNKNVSWRGIHILGYRIWNEKVQAIKYHFSRHTS